MKEPSERFWKGMWKMTKHERILESQENSRITGLLNVKGRSVRALPPVHTTVWPREFKLLA